MRKGLIAAVLLLFLISYIEIYAEDIELIKELMACPEEETFSELNSDNYIEALKSMGYYKYDYKDELINLRNATLRFQSDCNLAADGIQAPAKCGLLQHQPHDHHDDQRDDRQIGKGNALPINRSQEDAATAKVAQHRGNHAPKDSGSAADIQR